MTRCCPRCGGEVREPGLMNSEWRCERCGPVQPLRVATHISAEILNAVRDRVAAPVGRVPMWCPWPLPSGWTVTGVAWAGDDRSGPLATALALSGPAPFTDGPAEAVFVAEEPGVGLGAGLAGIIGVDPGGDPREAVGARPAQAKVRAAGHPTPLWSITSLEDRSAFVGEAKGVWLVAILWPAPAGYLLAEEIDLHDLTEFVPSELVFGAPSDRLRAGWAAA